MPDNLLLRKSLLLWSSARFKRVYDTGITKIVLLYQYRYITIGYTVGY